MDSWAHLNHDYAVAVTAGIECMIGKPLQWLLRGFVRLAAQRPSVGPLSSLWEIATQLLIELQLRDPG